ncbi:hypothetical protein M758_11G099000 [Ceratodon purpureus]|nr:hypothetical protein M758_11G099000 [Ceratodon purpureus]
MASSSRDTSMCDKLREKGNALYRQLAGPQVYAAPLRRMKCTQAEKYYQEALAQSRTRADRASCLKNLGMLHILWTRLELVDTAIVDDEPSFVYAPHLAYAKKKAAAAVGPLVEALHSGEGKPQQWLRHLQDHLVGFVEWAPRPLLRSLCEEFDLALGKRTVRCKAAVVAHLRFAEKQFGQGVLNLESHNFTGCISIMNDCMQLLRKAASLEAERDSDEYISITEMQERAETQIFVCESMQACASGDQVLMRALFDEEEVNLELAFEAIDLYRSAVLLTRERDIEGEAVAMSKLGKVYSEVIKDPERASKAHYQATKLALTVMSPRIARSDWYRYSSAKHAEHQEEVRRTEEREHEEKVAPTKKKLEEEIRSLDLEAKKEGRHFLDYIYQNHPNPDPKKTPGDMLKAENRVLTKEMLRKAISHYHPDANVVYGEEWQVLCEEISKILNLKYEYFKLEKTS